MKYWHREVLLTVSVLCAGVSNADADKEQDLDGSVSLQALPQLTAARGGSVGLSSTGAEGFQGSVDAKLVGGEPKVDLFTTLGGLDITSRLRIEFFGETFEQDVPRFLRDDSRLTREMFDASLVSAGFRGRYEFGRMLFVSSEQEGPCIDVGLKREGAGRQLLKGLSSKRIVKELPDAELAFQSAQQAEATARADLAKATLPAPDDPGYAAAREHKARLEVVCELAGRETNRNSRNVKRLRGELLALSRCNPDEWTGEAVHAVNLGARVLRRSPVSNGDEGSGSFGYAVEATYQYTREHRGYGLAISGGLSAIGFGAATDQDALSLAEYPRFNQARVSGSLEIRGPSFAAEEGTIPRAGIYVVGGHAWWTDPYTFGTIEPHVQSSEVEVGVYAGGRFRKGFHGLVAVRVVKPYGTDRDNLYIISLVPSVTSTEER